MNTIPLANATQDFRTRTPAEMSAIRGAQKGFVRLGYPYYSRGLIQYAVTANVLTPVKGDNLTFFSYGKNQSNPVAKIDPAGALTALYGSGTEADTNILQPGQTLDGEVFRIKGIGIIIQPESDIELAKRLLPECSLEISLQGGSSGINIGNPFLVPGGGGLAGGQFNRAIGTAGDQDGGIANGWPVYSNKLMIAEGLRWAPAGAKDSNLTVTLTVERSVPIAVSSSATSLRLDLMCVLIGHRDSDRSANL